MATLLVVVLTLGLRLIDDAFDRYEKFAKSKIMSLQVILGVTGTKNELKTCHPFNLPSRSRDLVSTSSYLMKYGRFFLTKLYPQKPLNRMARIASYLDKFLALVKSIEPYWARSDFDSFLEFLIMDNPNPNYWEEARKAIAKLNREKPELINQIRTVREKALLEIDQAIGELDSFLEAN